MIREVEALAALPTFGFLRKYVDYAAECTDANLVYHLATGLSLLTQTIPISLNVQFGAHLYGNLYSLIVGESSSSKKTTAINIGRNLLREIMPTAEGETPGSTEALIEGLRAAPRQLICYGEFGSFLAKAQEGYLLPLKTTYGELYDCLDESTEVLTERGWKLRAGVAVGDRVYSLNRTTGRMELTPITRKVERAITEGEKIFVAKGQRLDIRTTEGHEFHYTYELPRRAGEAAAHSTFRTKTGKALAQHRGGIRLPLSAELEGLPGCQLTDDELRFVAWFMSDGGFSGPYKVAISQTKPEQVEHIRALLTRLGLHFRERVMRADRKGAYPNARDCTQFVIQKGEWQRYAAFLNKDVSPLLSALTREQFRTFWLELQRGDGANTGRFGDVVWCETKIQADAYSALAVVRGFAPTITPYASEVTPGVFSYAVAVRDAQWMTTRPGDARAAKFRLEAAVPGEMVWCVSNRNSTLVTRRNGKVVIIGNCSPVGRATVKSRKGPVTQPRLSMLAGVTPGYLERHTELTDWVDGFMARWFCVFGKRERNYPIPTENRVKRAACLAHLSGLVDSRNVPTVLGNCLGLTPEATLTWLEWYDHVSNYPGSRGKNTAGAVSRATSFALKIALILSWDRGDARVPRPWHIEADILQAAIGLTDLHIRSILAVGETLADSFDMRERRKVLTAINWDPTSLGEITRGAGVLKKRALEMIETLTEEGLVGRITTSAKAGAYRRIDPRPVESSALAATQVHSLSEEPLATVISISRGSTSGLGITSDGLNDPRHASAAPVATGTDQSSSTSPAAPVASSAFASMFDLDELGDNDGNGLPAW